jgi:hypothetical protein
LLISSAKPPGTLGRFSTGLKSEWEFNRVQDKIVTFLKYQFFFA